MFIGGAALFMKQKYSDCVFGNLIFDSNIEFHGCIFVIETVFMPVVKIFIGVLLAIWNFFFAKYTPKLRIAKNTPIYCQKHSHCTFASRKNAMYPFGLNYTYPF